MLSLSFLLGALSLSTSVLGHTIFQELYVNGVDQGHTTGIRVPTYDGPITDVTSTDIICNGGASNGGQNALRTPLPTDIINVPAGATLTAEWHHTLSGYDASDPADPIDPSHHGPIMAYLAKVPSATQTTVTGLSWFKIYEDGLSGTTWAVDKLAATKGKVSFAVPSCIAPGNYLLRMELIALHGASSYPGAQFYVECAQINITGGGSASPATVSFPGAYHGSDPGITINIYYPTVTNYIIPGPRPFTCSGTNPPASSSTPVTPPSSSAVKSSSTSSPKPASTSSTKPASSATGGAPLYGQCGGTGWTGPTTCASGTCKVSNQFYSQCLP